MPVKPLSFKGDKKPSKKRKHPSSTSDPAPSTATTSASDAHATEDDIWTHPSSALDLSGPILLVIARTPTPLAITSDAHGTVFPTALENLIDLNPHTAEPHDVRQVWIASRLAGSSELSFKGSHGGYLASEAGTGVVSARREARGREEGWMVEAVVGDAEEGKTVQEDRVVFRLRTAASASAADAEAKYLAAEPGAKDPSKVTLRADAAEQSPHTQFVLRMQARFKPQLQAQKTQKASEKVSRRELEAAVGRKLEDDEVKRLKRARKDGTYHEEILDVRVKGKHDKFAS